jgi:hypothetical protein
MPSEHRNQVYDQDGTIVSEEVVTVADPMVTPDVFDQALKTMRNMMKTFTDPVTGAPVGTPSNIQMRNWLVALTHGVAYTHNALEELE